MDIQYKPKKPFTTNNYPCGNCIEKQAKYMCPKCKLPYCGIKCYKNHNIECSEEFYKTQVFLHLKSKKTSKSETKKISDILISTQEKSDIVLDEILNNTKEERLLKLNEIICKENDNLLEELNHEEKLKFSNFIKSGKIMKYIIE